jgi:hypothetical protein
MGTRGMYLNKWTLYFDLEIHVPSTVHFWLRLSHLPVYCWNDESLREIKNTLGKYIDIHKPKSSMFSCTRICVEVDLEKGLSEVINHNLDNWNHQQKLDYK